MQFPSIKSLAKLCALIALALLTLGTQAQIITNLANFHKGNGSLPEGVLVQGRNGNLYGTTLWGGKYNDGTIFTITTGGRLNTIYSFDYSDGYEPTTLVLDKYGDFYGIAMLGGPAGNGSIFKITPNGNFSLVYGFQEIGSGSPTSLVLGPDENFYGTYWVEGSTRFFRLTAAGAFSTLACSIQDASISTLGADGNFYGSTQDSGTNQDGSIFQLRPDGACTTLHSFDGTDGTGPGALASDNNGNFYGATYQGGTGLQIQGTFFRITANGDFTVLYSFTFEEQPIGDGLTYGSDGNLYGATVWGGYYGGGIPFNVSASGKYTQLGNFGGDVYYALPQMTQHTNGVFYGTSREGGKQGNGNVFSLDNSLSPFLGFVIGFSHPGNNTQFIGQNFTGTTAVSFNGVPASSFKVISDTYMTAVVPPGATTGLVTVTTPTGPLTSKLNFVVE